MSAGNSAISRAGSNWFRWDPHIHSPDTILNNQFGGKDAWPDYLSRLEASIPVIRAIGVTDYYVLDAYERVRAEKALGRLPQCDLIFPNVELRLTIGTAKGVRINAHLLVSPEDPDHLQHLNHFLSGLTFRAHEETFGCSRAQLIQLGKKSSNTTLSDERALRHGATQFKVSFEQLQDRFSNSEWARSNILVGVVAGTNDGTSGMTDAADATQRAELQKFADVIFSSNPNDRDYWLGLRPPGNADEIRRRFDGLKPCLHGCDAHELDAVGAPDGDRFSWIKGDPIFDSLRQACIVPEGRAFVGKSPPTGSTPSQTISAVETMNAPWMKTPVIELNSGLVAVIGARGSGKTALADIIAAGCDAISETRSDSSFLTRAEDHLAGSSVHIDWAAGGFEERPLDEPEAFAELNPRARYLSQQFVEKLCTSDGITDALLAEIERVIFEAHDSAGRDGAIDFEELLQIRAARFRQNRQREEQALATLSDRIGVELQNERLVIGLATQIADRAKLIAGYATDRGKLVAVGSEVRVARLEALNRAAEATRSHIRALTLREQDLLSVQDEVADVRVNRVPEQLRDIRSRHVPSGIDDAEWPAFELGFKGNVDNILAARLERSRKLIAEWKGQPIPVPIAPDIALVAADADLARQSLATLEAEIARLEAQISVDRATREKYAALSKRIVDETALHDKLKQQHEECSGAAARAVQFGKDRHDSYLRVFEALISEQDVLNKLYAPLMARLAQAGETLKKLSFSVSRVVDIEAWAAKGEKLFDLRRQGTFRGQGKLKAAAEMRLREPWEHGDAAAVARAMTAFRAENDKELLSQGPSRNNYAEYRAWARQFALWLYGTDHISVRYSVDYDGVDIRKLSPGTRGIVLLLLYLALDDADDRPLIIDQPEENLDPKSIYDELVGLFIEAKARRQVILVTHNANLVVNTDADQIIIATAGPHAAGDLPPITYTSGGLEHASIRKSVCDILEGGERAFRERAKRLRFTLDRML